jgi:phosphopantetheinyl transferase
VTHAAAVRWSGVGSREPTEDRRLLDADEAARAERIPHPAARARYVVAHATLRRLLGDLLGEDPAALRLDIDRLGRPGVPAASGWTVSIAHCVDLVVVAAGHGLEVGVDVERRDRRPLPRPERWCSTVEAAACRRPAATEAALPLVLWTGKEAVAKAIGLGMGMPFRELDLLGARLRGPVTQDLLDAGLRRPVAPVRVDDGGIVRWLDLSPRHVIALATLPVASARDQHPHAASAAPCGPR